MFEGVVAGVLNRWLGKYVQDLDTEHLNVGIFSGHVTLQDLKLKPDALYELDLPIDVKIGSIGKINFKIPWSGLYAQPVVINVEDVLVLVGPAISNTYYDPEREKRLIRAAKKKILQDLESESEQLAGPNNFFENLFTAIVNNIQIFIRNVHIRYEDSISSKEGPLACGLCLQSIAIETTNSKWKPSVTPAGASTVYQMMRLESLSLYWNPKATVLDDEETMHITPIQYYNWKHYMLHGLDKFSMHREDFDFLVKPLSCKVKVIINKSGEARVPRLLVDAVILDGAMQVSRAQYLSTSTVAESFRRININRKYRQHHPRVPVAKHTRLWWNYAYNVVLEQRVRPYTWRSIKTHRDHYHDYKRTYKSTLRSPNDTELKLDLQMCEDRLPIIAIVMAREQAKFELLAEEPERIEVRETEIDWWRVASSEDESDNESTQEEARPACKSNLELCVKTDKHQSLWSHLSSPEKQKICELIGYVEGAPNCDKPKQYIEHKLNLTLANWSLTLLHRGKEVLVLTASHFLASVETRPAARAYKVSARAESIAIEGANVDGDLVPILSADNVHSGATSTNLLAVDFEKNPLNSEADYGISCTLEPVELIYQEHACTEVINFIQTRPMDSEALLEAVTSHLERAASVTRSLLAYAVARKKVFNVNVDLKGPYLLLPEHGSIQKGGNVLVLDLGRVTIKSDVQPGGLAGLEDATCTELEERLYDRLHAECSAIQVLFCDSGEHWREMRKQPDSEVHLLPRLRAHLVFSNSIKKDYRLLPRYKLNVSISSVKLNLSDRIISQLLEFMEHLPLPTPHTVPVTLVDSGNSILGQDPELAEFLELDKMQPDPPYKHLLRLRKKIVAAYVAKAKTPESTHDAVGARLGFQASAGAFQSSDHSEEEMEVYARSVDLPGFDDNVSPNNTISTLLRLVIGEIVVNVCRSHALCERPYVMLRVGKVCLDMALMQYGPAVQLSVRALTLTDKQPRANTGQYLDIVTTHDEEILNLLYRKVRANCPDFKSHFHSVEQSLVADVGAFTLNIHGEALPTLLKYLQYIHDKIQKSRLARVQRAVVERGQRLWDLLMTPGDDPPVPPGATKFSYSCRVSGVKARLCHLDCDLLEVKLAGLESDCVFKANDRMILKLFLHTLMVDDLSDMTLYPKLLWLEEDKVLEVKYVRHAPRIITLGGEGEEGGGSGTVKSDGSLRVYLGRLHIVLLYKILVDLQQFMDGLVPGGGGGAGELVRGAERGVGEAGAAWDQGWHTRLTLAVELHAPTLLLPQKCSSPNLIVFNTGDLLIENFFKEITSLRAESPMQNPVIDNILIKLVNITFSRAVMTLAGTLEAQEPILEPVCVRWDVKRLVGAVAGTGVPAAGLLQYEASGVVEPVVVTLGQRDLATILAVYADNFTQQSYIGSANAGSPVETAAEQTDTSVKKLQAFFAQADPVRKEASLRLSVEGVEMKLYLDAEEVVSSPVREPTRGLARLSHGSASLHLHCYSDKSLELNYSLQSLLLEDIRPDPTIVIKRMFQSHGGKLRCADAAISVSTPPIIDLTYRRNHAGDRNVDIHVEKTRLNFSVPFFMSLGRFLLETMPGEKSMEGGVVNHGYVGETHMGRQNNNTRARPPSSADSSGYYSQGASMCEDSPGLCVSAQFRKPEVMFFTDPSKTEGHALLVRTELLIDYSCLSNRQSMTVSLAGLQVLSKLQSKLVNRPPQLVLQPCDVELCRSYRGGDEGVKVSLSLSCVDVHLAPTTVHTLTDIVGDIMTELTIPEEKEAFNFATYNPKLPESEDLWSPKKLVPYLSLSAMGEGDTYTRPRWTPGPVAETFTLPMTNVRVTMELEATRGRVSVVVLKSTCEATLHDWSRQLHGCAHLTAHASVYNEHLDTWEPLLEPVMEDENTHRPWHLTVNVFQAKSYSMSSRLQDGPVTETDNIDSKRHKRKSKRSDSETSGDEDEDNEMMFIRSPHKASVGAVENNLPGVFTDLEGDSDSDNEKGLMDRLSGAIVNLFTDESSCDEASDGEGSSGAEHSEGEGEEHPERPLTYTDSRHHKMLATTNKTVLLQEEPRENSVDSGLEADGLSEKLCTYLVCDTRDPLNVTLTPHSTSVLYDLVTAFTTKGLTTQQRGYEAPVNLVNDIGPGSSVSLVTRAQMTLAGRDQVLATADYDVDTSRPSTPGSLGDRTDQEEQGMDDVEDDWERFEGGFATDTHTPLPTPLYSPALSPTADLVSALYRKVTDERLVIKLQQFEELSVVCPQRSVSKLHVLQPSRNNTRYYVVLQRDSHYKSRRIVLRSPLQFRNETSYALEVLYRRTELEGALVGGEEVVVAQGELTNPFDDKMRLAVVAPDDTYNVPLYVAYHCRLYLQPTNYQSAQTASSGVWWMDLATEMGEAKNLVCHAKEDQDTIFAMRILTETGVEANKVTRAIPNYLIRAVPPLALHNRLPYAAQISVPDLNYKIRVEAGERTYAYLIDLNKTHKVTIEINYLALPWSGTFNLCDGLTERNVSMRTECETDGGNKELSVSVKVERNESWEVFLHAPYWLINKTGLPLQIKASHSDSIYDVTEEPLLFAGALRRRAFRRRGTVRVRAHHSAWSKAFALEAVGAPGLVVCTHPERKRKYRILLNVTLSELCPQLTRIVSLLPYFLIYNDSRRPLRFMEENEAADLWIDLAPAQALPFHPHTDSMRLHCKFRDSALLSHHFPITRPHKTVLRMDKGGALCVEVTGGVETPFTVTFRAYSPGDAPVRIDNLCDDLFLKLHQIDSGQVALLSPYQSTLYTWDDPCKDRTLVWNIYNNKANGFVANFTRDGYGEEKVSFHSVKQPALTPNNSVTSKLSSTLKLLTPRSPEPGSSSSDDSDASDPADSTNRTRKDKVIVYWVSYMEVHQRVLVLTQDERIAYQYRVRINSERSNYEVYTSLSSMGLSVCIQTASGVKELAYASVTDSLPRWEVNVNHKWKLLTPELSSWIEDKYRSDATKCQMRKCIDIDFEKMQMTKPFFSELRRTYNPAIWMQLRRSDTLTYAHIRFHRFQVDNQLSEAVFPCVMYPAPLPASLARNSPLKPCVELVVLKETRPALDHDIYKYVKVLVQEYRVNVDRGFANRVFHIMNGWKREAKPAVRLRADLALVHAPLASLAPSPAGTRAPLFEYVHISPLKLTVSVSSRGCSPEQCGVGSPEHPRSSARKENRPKLFNSDLLEYLFNSWGSSLCDVKDVTIRMAYLELRSASASSARAREQAARHYTTQLLQQFYVLILGLDILGNPYSKLADFTHGLTQSFYEPHTGECGASPGSMAYKLGYGVSALLGHCVSGVARAGSVLDVPLLHDHALTHRDNKKRYGYTMQHSGELPESVTCASGTYEHGVSLALAGLLAQPTQDVYRTAAALSRQAEGGGGGGGAEEVLRTALDRGSGGRIAARIRLPRHCDPYEGVKAYSLHEALGVRLLSCLGRGHYADTDTYLAHAPLARYSRHLVLLTTQRLFMVRGSGVGAGGAAWQLEWVIKLEDLMEVPTLTDDNKLVLHIKQNELVNYFSSDEKTIESTDAEVMSWLQGKIESALILRMEDKRCPAII